MHSTMKKDVMINSIRLTLTLLVGWIIRAVNPLNSQDSVMGIKAKKIGQMDKGTRYFPGGSNIQ